MKHSELVDIVCMHVCVRLCMCVHGWIPHPQVVNHHKAFRRLIKYSVFEPPAGAAPPCRQQTRVASFSVSAQKAVFTAQGEIFQREVESVPASPHLQARK